MGDVCIDFGVVENISTERGADMPVINTYRSLSMNLQVNHLVLNIYLEN